MAESSCFSKSPFLDTHWYGAVSNTRDGRPVNPGTLLPSPTSTHCSATKSSSSNNAIAKQEEITTIKRPLSPPNSQQPGSPVNDVPVPSIQITQPQPSSAPAPDMSSVEYHDILKAVSPDLLANVVDLRSYLIPKLVEFRNQSRDLCDQDVHFRAAMDRLRVGVETLLNSQALLGEVQKLTGLWDDALRTAEVLYERAEELQKTSKDLSTREDRLRRKEEVLYQRISQVQGKQSLNGTSLPHDIYEEISSSSVDSEAAQPLPVKQYYEQVAHADHLREDFLDFRASTYEERRERSRLRQLDQPVTPSESKFLADYFRERDAKSQAFAEALAIAYQLRDDCRQRGYPVEDVEIPPLNDNDIFDEGLLIPQALVELSASEKGDTKGQENFDDLLVDMDHKHHVSQWLQAVSPEESTEPQTSALAYHETSTVWGDDTIIDLQSAGKNLHVPDFRRERSASQPPTTASTTVRSSGNGVPLTLSTNLQSNLDGSRPKSAPVILYVREYLF